MELHDYQKYAVSFIEEHPIAALFLDMGLGKTITTLTAIHNLMFNLFAVWALTGLWHGANFNFIAWGIYYFVILVLEKYVYGKYLEKLPSLLKHIYALFLILLGWTIFYFEDFGQFATYLTSMFTLKNGIIGNTYVFADFDCDGNGVTSDMEEHVFEIKG